MKITANTNVLVRVILADDAKQAHAAQAALAKSELALGGETFVSFDKDAVKRLKKLGHAAALLT